MWMIEVSNVLKRNHDMSGITLTWKGNRERVEEKHSAGIQFIRFIFKVILAALGLQKMPSQ
jgi:hypothetical protein